MNTDNKLNTYNELIDKFGQNKLEHISIQILNTVNEMQNLQKEYTKYKNIVYLELLNSCFNELKEFLWFKFCCQIRDYSDMLFELFKIERYSNVKKYILSTKFIKTFIGSDSYTALSITLHNFNDKVFNESKWDKSFSIYKDMNSSLNLDLNIIKKEFETVIFMFRSIENYKNKCVGICINNSFPIFQFFGELLHCKNK